MRGLEVLAGNPQAKHRLSAGRGLSHAYILSGPAGSGKHTLAGLLARALVCSGRGEAPCGACPDCRKAAAGVHPDVITIGEAGKDISVAMVRALRSDAYIRPNEAPRKVYLLPDAHTMNQSAQNALLKLLEEGPPYAAFLLLAENGGGVLQTVRSRCEELSLTPLEFSILWYLCQHRGQVVSSEALFEAVWGERYFESNNTVMSHIARLREKMHEPSRKPKFIKTVWGVGYTIE